MAQVNNTTKDRLIKAIAAIKEVASKDVGDDFEGRGKYSKLSAWMTQKLSQYGESGVSDQSVSNWSTGRIGVNGLDDSTSRKLGILLGMPASIAAPLFKLHLCGGFELPHCGCEAPGVLSCACIAIARSLPSSELVLLRDLIDQELQEGAIAMCLLLRVWDLFDEDEFVYRLDAANKKQEQRYRDIYHGVGGKLTEVEKRLIITAIERETGTSAADLLDACDEQHHQPV